jgi:hypothetical protein
MTMKKYSKKRRRRKTKRKKEGACVTAVKVEDPMYEKK